MMKLIAIVVVSLFHTAALKGLVGRELARKDDDDELTIDNYERGWEINPEHEIPPGVPIISPAVQGDKYQGDEILTAEQKAAKGLADRFGMVKELDMRQAITSATRKWPKGADGKVYVPYVFGTSFTENEKDVLARGFAEYAKNTCIRMRKRSNENDYVRIIKDSGCYSYVGRIGGAQDLSLDNGCLYDIGTSMHEFMHAIGYQHEQSRSDRDKYVKIIWKNIPNKYRNNFEIDNNADLQGLPYDTGSVMHYDATAFGSGKVTIKSITGAATLGQRNGFSSSDIVGLNKLYCEADKPNPTKPTKPKCEDLNNNCPGWAKDGDCESGAYIQWMENNCKKSCGVCGAGGKCTDNPSEWAISVKWTCQTYVDYKFPMGSYCKSAEWKKQKLCGKVCAAAGYTTDPNCK